MMLKKDLRQFEVCKPIQIRDEDGAVYNEYAGPCGAFMGNIQPLSGKAAAEQFGIEMTRAYIIYTDDLETEIYEMYRLSGGSKVFEVKTVQSWVNYRKLACGEVILPDGESD